MGMVVNKMDKRKDIITIDVLHKAMQRSNTDAIRINRALGLDTVYMEGNRIVKEDASGTVTTVKVLDRPSSVKITLNERIKLK